jgi:O-antigen ligase
VGPGEPRKYLATLDIYHAHNNIVQVAFETGIPSAVIYTVMIGLLLLLPLRTMMGDRRTFMSTLPILAYFSYSWTGSPLSFPAATLMLAAVANEARLAMNREDPLLHRSIQKSVSISHPRRSTGFGSTYPAPGRPS